MPPASPVVALAVPMETAPESPSEDKPVDSEMLPLASAAPVNNDTAPLVAASSDSKLEINTAPLGTSVAPPL
ncbi:unnamed protein product [Phytophthora lilii]|uniref:Unnamed protein product n=1 Tax=Phytophthora lilii TaxID=2077276 RepID=A0A9W6XKL7_9STRA|nr:unnamed protein product [Phytophthora lilii]